MRVSKRSSARRRSVSPRALWPKRKFSPTDTCVAPSAPTSTSSMNCCAVRAAKSRSNGTTTSSCTPSDSTSAALRCRSVSSRGAAPGATTAVGCGSNVSDRVGARDDLAMAEVHAVERPDGDAPRARLARRAGRDLHARKPTTGFRAPSLGSATAIGPSASTSSTGPPPSLPSPAGATVPGPASARGPAGTRAAGHRDRHAVRGALRVVAGEPHRRHEAQRVGERDDPRGVGVGDRERPDRRAPQLRAVRVAEVGDQRAHVRAGGAVDRERRAVVLAPELLEAVDRDRPRRRARPPPPPARARTRACRRPSRRCRRAGAA